MKIVFLDVKTIGDDIDLSGFEQLGEVIKFGFTRADQVAERVKDADVVVLNKVQIKRDTLGDPDHLKLICVTATGTNNLDKELLDEKGIAWRNVAGYSTESVAQHTFSLLFYLIEHLPYYDIYVKSGDYAGDELFTHFAQTFHEISGKTWGIIGLGNIGRRVADIAKVFGCKVIYHSTSGANHNPDYTEVSLDELLATSDIVSVHAPLTEQTEGLMNYDNFCKMKPTSIFLNLGRGPIVVEKDLRRALDEGKIGAAGLDVLSVEPMSQESPFLENPPENLFITPHIAWASIEARTRLMKIIEGQIKEFYNM